MHRKVAPSKKEEKPSHGIESERKTVVLPTTICLFGIFPSLASFDLTRIKRVSRNFKALSDAYAKQTESQIFYAVSSDCQVEIGRETMRGALVTQTMTESISGSQLIHAFKYEWDTSLGRRPNKSMWIFRSEIDALNFLTTPGVEGLSPRLYRKVWIADDWDKQIIQVTPIYRVQLVHANICYSNDLGKKLINVEEFKRDDEHHRRSCYVETSNLLPVSASVKFKFFEREPLKTLIENYDLKRIEPEMKSEKSSLSSRSSSRRKCVIM